MAQVLRAYIKDNDPEASFNVKHQELFEEDAVEDAKEYLEEVSKRLEYNVGELEWEDKHGRVRADLEGKKIAVVMPDEVYQSSEEAIEQNEYALPNEWVTEEYGSFFEKLRNNRFNLQVKNLKNNLLRSLTFIGFSLVFGLPLVLSNVSYGVIITASIFSVLFTIGLLFFAFGLKDAVWIYRIDEETIPQYYDENEK